MALTASGVLPVFPYRSGLPKADLSLRSMVELGSSSPYVWARSNSASSKKLMVLESYRDTAKALAARRMLKEQVL